MPIDIFWYKSIEISSRVIFQKFFVVHVFSVNMRWPVNHPEWPICTMIWHWFLVWSSFYRVLFVNFVALFWNVYLAWKSEASHRKYQPDVHMRQDVWCIWTMFPYHVLKASLNMSDSGVAWKLKFILQNFLYSLFNDCSNFISFARGGDMICYLKC